MLLDTNPANARADLMIPLDHITAADADRVGGKAYHCAQLKQAGLPVPDGIAVTVEAIDHVDLLSAQLGSGLAQFPTNARFAVRSSAADEDSVGHSFAGIHDTKLNVAPDGIPSAIRACWASVQSPTALAYRHSQALPTDDIRTGILIQLMIQPTVSGVAFTVNPMTGRSGELVINATWGLGEALVGGQVEPDEFRVNKADRTILSTHIGEKHGRVVAEHGVSRLIETDDAERDTPSLTPDQLRELAVLLSKIEELHDAPQDVEWCHDGRQFWIVQTRPITTNATTTDADIEWTRANLREVLPDLPAPQTLHIICDLLEQATRRFYGNMLAPADELGPMVESFYGRPYFNFSQFRYLSHRAGLPLSMTMRGWGHSEAITAQDEIVAPRTVSEIISTIPDVTYHGPYLTARRRVHRQFTLVDTSLKRLVSCDPKTLSDVQLIDALKRESEPLNASVDMALLLAAGIGMFQNMLQAICKPVHFSVEQLQHTHLASGEKTVSAQQGFDLLALAHTARGDKRTQHYFLNAADSFDHYRETLQDTPFLDQFDHFLSEYGHRGPYESDLAIPRYRENPTLLLQAIRGHVHAPTCPSPASMIAQQDSDAETTRRAFDSQLTPWQRLTLRPRVHRLLRRLKQWFLWRERNRSESIRLGADIRRWQLTLAQRFIDRGWIETHEDYFFSAPG